MLVLMAPRTYQNLSSRPAENLRKPELESLRMADFLHQLWRSHFDESDRLWERYKTALAAWYELPWKIRKHTPQPRSPNLAFPEELRGMTCGARTRAGTPCKRKDLYGSGRCKLHGGLSTGPRTKRGKRRSAKNGFKRVSGKRTP